MTRRRSEQEAAAKLKKLRREILGGPAPAPGPDTRDRPGETNRTTEAAADGSARTRGDDRKHRLREVAQPAPAAIRPDPHRGGRQKNLSSRSLRVADTDNVHKTIQELLEHRRRRRGKVVGIAGQPRHGKTTLADRLRERAAERPGVDLRYSKTVRGDVNVYYIPGRRAHPALIDLAGEDYTALGNYDQALPKVMEKFLWPVLQRLDGLILLLALPIVWAGWNDEGEDRRSASRQEKSEMEAMVGRMLNAHRMLIKYAIVARNLGRLGRKGLKLGDSTPPTRNQVDDACRHAHAGDVGVNSTPPTRNQVDDAFRRSRPYDRPVSLVFSKADLYVGPRRSCLHSPSLPGLEHLVPEGVHPLESDPLLVAAGHFPEFQSFLERHVRHFKWSFCQALQDKSPNPDPNEAGDQAAGISSLLGGEGVMDFVTSHPWRVPGLSTARYIRLDRALRRDAWGAALSGSTPGRSPKRDGS